MSNQRSTHRRVIDEIKPAVIKSKVTYVLIVIFIVLYAALYGVYAVNTAKPLVGGVSYPFLYSLVIWWLILIFTIVAAKVCWR